MRERGVRTGKDRVPRFVRVEPSDEHLVAQVHSFQILSSLDLTQRNPPCCTGPRPTVIRLFAFSAVDGHFLTSPALDWGFFLLGEAKLQTYKRCTVFTNHSLLGYLVS